MHPWAKVCKTTYAERVIAIGSPMPNKPITDEWWWEPTVRVIREDCVNTPREELNIGKFIFSHV